MFTLRTAKHHPECAAHKESYKVDFPLQMAECEANYLRLTKLVTDLEADEYRYILADRRQDWLQILRIIERSRYTTTLEIKHVSVVPVTPWLHMPCLTVRMYHDARLAEVLAWEGHKRLRPRYDYPNRSMYQSDEKLQINQFLGECLMRCLNHGYGVDRAIDLVGN